MTGRTYEVRGLVEAFKNFCEDLSKQLRGHYLYPSVKQDLRAIRKFQQQALVLLATTARGRPQSKVDLFLWLVKVFDEANVSIMFRSILSTYALCARRDELDVQLTLFRLWVGGLGLLDRFQKLRRQARIFHISDIHYGGYHHRFSDGASTKRMADYWLDYCRSIPDEDKPDIIVISGDLTSKALPREFAECKQFVKDLTVEGPDEHRRCMKKGKARLPAKRRLLIVPGNHDVRWLPTKGDRLKTFTKFVRRWGVPSVLDGNSTHPCPIPDAFVDFEKEYGICFHLLTSCYYDGKIPEAARIINKMQDKLRRLRGGKGKARNPDELALAELKVHMRNGLGIVTLDYIDRISHTVRKVDLERRNRDKDVLTFAVIHHTPLQLGHDEAGYRSGGDSLMEVLAQFHYAGLLSGHNHKRYPNVPVSETRVLTIPAGSLSVKDTDKAPHSFLVIDVFKAQGSRVFWVFYCDFQEAHRKRWPGSPEWGPAYKEIWPQAANAWLVECNLFRDYVEDYRQRYKARASVAVTALKRMVP